MSKSQRYDGHPLNDEIERLYVRKNELEKKLSGNWEHFSENYPGILLRSVFKKAGIGPSVIKAFVNLSKIQEIIGRLTMKVFTWLGSIANNWFHAPAE